MKCFIAIALSFLSFNATAEMGDQTAPVTAIEESGINNIYRVSSDLYRSGQPSAKQMKALENMGVNSILNLRQFNSDERKVKGTELNLYEVSMNAGRINDEQMIEALKTINKAPKPLLVHCWHGSDRTGAVIAMYRVVFDGWTKAAAIEELKQPKYGHHESFYQNIPDYIERADIEAIRQAVFDGQH